MCVYVYLETAIYKAPEIFSNTESPTTGRTQIQESSNGKFQFVMYMNATLNTYHVK